EASGLRAIGVISLDIWYFHNRAAQYRTAGRRVLTGRPRKQVAKGIQSFGAWTITAGKIHYLAVKQQDERKLAVTQSHRPLCDRIKHGLNIRWRARNDAQHLRCRRLLLQRLPQLI